MGDHVLVVESGQSDARGMAVMAAAKQAIPGKPIRFVVNSHPHFDHAGGLRGGGGRRRHDPDAPQQRARCSSGCSSGPRTLSGDSLSKASRRAA